MAEDDSMIRIIQSLGLDYSSAINSTKMFEARIASLNQQLLQLKANALQGARDINQAFSSQLGSLSGGKTLLDQYGQPLKTIKTESAKVSTGMATGFKSATVVAKEHAQTVQDITKKYNLLASEMQRRNLWFISGGMFYGTLKAAQEAVQTISEVEMGVTQIARVMEDSTFVFKDYRDQLLQLGVDYGQTFETVQDIALRWAQAGYNVRDSLENTRVSLLALNTAELDASRATESLIGIMAQWNLTSKDLPLVLDKINKTADDYTVTSQDLIDGLLKSSEVAKNFGLTLDQNIALLTVMREASGATGKEIGNALKSILTFTQREKSIDVLERLGIRVYADELKTQFRPVWDIFQDIAARWDTASKEIQDGFIAAADDAGLMSDELTNLIGIGEKWTDVQKRDIAEGASGAYRRNYFISLIKRLADAQEVLNNMMDAAGYSQAENVRTMDTLEKKYNSLKAAVQQLAVALGDAGLLEILKSLTDTATNTASAFAKMDDDTKALILTVLELLAAFKALQSVLALFTTKGIMTLAGSAAALVGLAPGIGQIVAAIAALTAGIGLLAYNLQKANAETLKDVNAKQQELEQTNNLINSYEMLKSKSEQTTEVKNQLLSIQKQLAAIYPEYVDAIDEEGNKLVTNIPLLREMLNLKQQELDLKRQDLLVEAQGKLPQLRNEYQRLQDEIKETKQKLASGDTKETRMYGGYAIEIDIREQLRQRLKTLLPQASEVAREIYLTEQSIKQILGLTTTEEQEMLRQRMRSGISAGTTVRGTTAGGTGTGGTGYTGYEDKYVLNLDRYMKLNAILDNINISLQQAQTLQNQVNGIDKLKYIEQEKNLLLEKQMALHNINEEYRKEQKEIQSYLSSYGIRTDANGNLINADEIIRTRTAAYNSFKANTDEEKAARQQMKADLDKLVDKVQRYYEISHKLIPQTSEDWWEVQSDINKISNKILQVYKDNIDELSQYGNLYINEIIESWQYVLNKYKDNIEVVKAAQKGLFDAYKDILSEQKKAIKDAYDERIQQIEDEAEAKKKAQQEIIDGIEKELDLLDRQESEYSYEQKIADLKEQLAYWSVRTSEEARQKVAEINKQIDEAEHDREVELQRQKLEDKKKAAQDEIDAIEEAAKEEKNRYEKSYKLVEKAFDEHSINIIARAATMSKEAFQQWVDNYIVPLQNALTSGSLADFESISAGLESGISSLPSHDWGMSDADYQKMMANKERWWELQAAGFKQSTNAEMQRLNTENDAIRRKYGRNPALGEYPKFHEGAKTLSYGLAMFKPGELIFPPDLSKKLEDLISALYARPVQQSQSSVVTSTDNRKIFNGPLLNVENMNMEDKVDSEILSRELRMAIDAL